MERKKNEQEKNFDFDFAVGQRLSAVRKRLGLSQNEVCDAIGVSQASLSQLEQGHRAWSMAATIKLIQYYNADYNEIFGESRGNPQTLEKDSSKLSEALFLLEQLSKSAGSPDVDYTCTEYIKVCIYRLIRHLYQTNPRHEKTRLFSLEPYIAEYGCYRCIEDTPQQLESLIVNSSRLLKNVEIPVEYSNSLRDFINEAEALLLDCYDNAENTALKQQAEVRYRPRRVRKV